MGQIQVLNEVTANQIAAGEVVERPASVIKELIENSLDAGATQIDIQIEEGGIRKLIITDNGVGMSPDDAILCFSRYATSKIKSVQDLASLLSFGFRGEALASIASVSKVTLITRQASAQLATKVEIHGGKILNIGESGGPIGTRLEIESLFFNTPARLKFLKSTRSESSAIESVVREAALSKPETGFRFQTDGVLKLEARQALSENRRFERTVNCLGEDCRDYLFPVEAQTDFLKISGYVVAPLVTRKDSSGIYLYVNNRYVRDKQLVQAIKVAYRTLLEIGRHPVCALNIELNPEEVDINVHPQKLEVRFSEPSKVQSHVIRLLSDFLATTPWLKREAPERTYVLRDIEPALRQGFGGQAQPAGFEIPIHNLGGAERYADLKIIGQADNTFLLLEGEKSMIVLDQHAAHERVVFEKVQARAKENGVSSQALLFPVSITLTPNELNTLSEKKEAFLPYGFEIEPFGDHQAIVKSAPPGLKTEFIAKIIKDTLSDLTKTDRPDSLNAFSDHICAQIACHTSVRAGQKLDHSEIRALLEQLDIIDYAAHCPHGRPVVRAIPFSEMGQWFHRT